MVKTQLELKRGKSLAINDKLPILEDISDRLGRMDLTKSDIQREFGVTFHTASEWYKQAALMRAKQDNGLTREGERAIHKGQIDRMLNKLATTLENTSLDLEERLKIHDRLIKYLDARARITGLNSETQLNLHAELKPLTIIRNETDVEQAGNDNIAMSHNVPTDTTTEGTTISLEPTPYK